MRGLGYAVGILCLLISGIAYWEGMGFRTSVVNVSPPTGFCELNKTNLADVEYFDGISNFAKVGGFSVVAAYADCLELAESRKSGTFIATKFAFLRWDKTADRPPSQFITEACDQVRQSGASDEQKALRSRYVTEFSKGLSSLKDVLPLGVLDEVRGTVCYSAKLIKAQVVNTGDVTLVYASAMTTIGNQPILMAQWTNYVDATSVATALASLKTTYSDFAAANGKTSGRRGGAISSEDGWSVSDPHHCPTRR